MGIGQYVASANADVRRDLRVWVLRETSCTLSRTLVRTILLSNRCRRLREAAWDRDLVQLA
jgi:hypothetical protein